ncbi:hypothetical protein ACQ4PT_016081 [Festuca glaucescens]
MGMLHEKPVQHCPLRDDGDGTGTAWTGEKRRRKHPPTSSSSDAPAATAQDHQGPISPTTDMEGVIQDQGQDHELRLARSDSEQHQQEEIWGPEVEISQEDAANYTKCLSPDAPPIYTRSSMTDEEEEDLNLRLARYRIAYYKNVAEPELARELKDPKDYSVEELQDNRYFLHLGSHRSFEGCFHPIDTWVAELNDYQRLLVFNGSRDSSDSLYIYWEDYHAYYRTYEVDDAYVKFYEELSSKVKEYIAELREDKVLEDWSLFYFEIWKLNDLKKGSLRDAVQEAYEMEKFGLEFEGMGAESKARSISFFEQKFRFLTREVGITENFRLNRVKLGIC